MLKKVAVIRIIIVTILFFSWIGIAFSNPAYDVFGRKWDFVCTDTDISNGYLYVKVKNIGDHEGTVTVSVKFSWMSSYSSKKVTISPGRTERIKFSFSPAKAWGTLNEPRAERIQGRLRITDYAGHVFDEGTFNLPNK